MERAIKVANRIGRAQGPDQFGGGLCNRHQISQAQYYQWRDRLIKEGGKLFDYGGPTKSEENLKQQVGQLQRIIGELTVELKKSEELGL